MRHQRLLRAEDRPDPVAGVVAAVLHRHGPLQHRPEALAHAPRGLRLVVPEGGEDRQHVGARHVGNQACADAGEGVAFQARQPAFRVPAALPAGPLLVQHAAGGVGERRRLLRAAFLRERVAALAGQLTVGQRLLARLGERDQLRAAEPEFLVPAADDEPLDPAAGPGRLHEEIQALPVAVASRPRRPHEEGGEGLVGMAAAGLRASRPGRRAGRAIHSRIISWNTMHGIGRS